MVAGDAGMGEAGQIGVGDGDAVDRSGQVAEAEPRTRPTATGAAPARARTVSSECISAP